MLPWLYEKRVWVTREAEKPVFFIPFYWCLGFYLKGVVCHAIRLKMNGSAFVHQIEFGVFTGKCKTGEEKVVYATPGFHFEIYFTGVALVPNEYTRSVLNLRINT